MKEQNEWIFYKELDFNDPENNRFNIDTRDFHAGYSFSKTAHPDYLTLRKYPDFFNTEQELKNLLNRYFEESGGKGDWRMFDLSVSNINVNNWRLKYLRIYRTDLGFIVCNSDSKAITKTVLDNPVSQKHLNFCAK